MKDQLIKIFDETCVGSSDFVSLANVKVENESVYYYNRNNKRGNYRVNYQGRGGYRGRNIATETTMPKAVIRLVKIEEIFLKTDNPSSLQDKEIHLM